MKFCFVIEVYLIAKKMKSTVYSLKYLWDIIYLYIYFYFGGYFLKANMCNVFHGFDKKLFQVLLHFLFRKSNKVKEKNIVIHKVCYNNIKPHLGTKIVCKFFYCKNIAKYFTSKIKFDCKSLIF